ncbi:MAG: glycoside hydrolase family 5 protein [Bacteroidetes bacterium]|nr:MAG: glycoside hydrolase family 5 protein [Bacteroidota bacterium]
MRRHWKYLLLLIVFASCQKPTYDIVVQPDPEEENENYLAFLRNRAIGKGINFGNALEAPEEGLWGLTIQESYIHEVKNAGFNSVRLPIAWSSHTDTTAPYSIDPEFLSRVDEVIGWCLDRQLTTIITIHHFNELYEFPEDSTYREMFFSIWEQLTIHYKETNHDKLIFEPLNEPHHNLTPARWNILIPEILEVIRGIDTERTLIIDGPDWAYHGSLYQLQLPDDEHNVIVSVRYYQPYDFTHQGAHWVENSDQWLGLTWAGTNGQVNQVMTDMNAIKSWSELNNRPVTIGEFGCIAEADHQSRGTWTSHVRKQMEAQEFSWSYFDFGVVFKAYDIENGQWLDGFLNAFFD